MVNLIYSPIKGEVTRSTLDGVDRLPGKTSSEKEVDFVDSYSANNNDTYYH